MVRMYISVCGIGVLILFIIFYGFYIGDRLVSLDTPLVNAVTRIKLEAAIAGLMVEEVLSSGIAGSLESNWEPLDAALATLRELMKAQTGWKSAFLPFQRPGLQNLIDELEKKRIDWSASAQNRVEDQGSPLVMPDAALTYQLAFFKFMETVNRLETRLKTNLNINMGRFRQTQWALIILSMLLTILSGAVFFRFERQRSRYLQEILLSSRRLAAEIEERKVTARRLAERTEALERSNKDLQQFAYVASHDLQEPLRMVTSYVKLLERRYKAMLDSDAGDFIDFAVDGATRMQRMIQDLLSYSRVNTHGRPSSPTDLQEVLKQVVINLRLAIDESGARITNGSLPMVDADPTQLVQLFQNLIANAIKFRGNVEPRIHISAKKEGHYWSFSVKDNGIGFDPELADRIFTIFQRLHTKNEYPGTGIGLSICKKIVERHGGSIWVTSSPGAGSTFFFTLPVNAAI